MYSSSLSLTWFKRNLLYYNNMILIVYIIDIYRTSGSSTSLQTTDSFHHTVAKLCFLHLVHLIRDIDCGHHTLMSLNNVGKKYFNRKRFVLLFKTSNLMIFWMNTVSKGLLLSWYFPKTETTLRNVNNSLRVYINIQCQTLQCPAIRSSFYRIVEYFLCKQTELLT
mgnify:CR=1 FL=1